jgi:metal-responsive CopG/Arc/MetJ family transcriptional regulator
MLICMSTQLAVRVTEDQLKALDTYAAFRGYENRADAIRAAIAEAIKRANDEAIDQAYRDRYAEFPETEQEMAEAHNLALAAIREEPSRLEDWL